MNINPGSVMLVLLLGPTENDNVVGCRAGVCYGLLLGTGSVRGGYQQLIRATFKRPACDETPLQTGVGGSSSSAFTEDLKNHAASGGLCIYCQHVCCSGRCLYATVRPGSPRCPQLGPGGPAPAPVRRQAGTAPADRWGWTGARLRGPNSV